MLRHMGYRLVTVDPDPASVRRLTYVPFLDNGECVVVPLGDGRIALPAGDVEPGEDYLLDTSLRVPLMTAGFRLQGVQPFAVAEAAGPAPGLHVYAWIVGHAPYEGRRPHVTIELVRGSAERIAERFEAAHDQQSARVVRDAARSYRSQDEASYYASNLRLLEPAYLRGRTPQEGSGFGGAADEWRAAREQIVDGLNRDGTFLDLGCANGLLMESVQLWAAERGLHIEPFGVDISARLVDLARRRLPAWSERIEIGNAIDWVPLDGRTFTFVHTLLDCVPRGRRGDLIRHAMDHLVEPGGRVIVSHYQLGAHLTARQYVERLGLRVEGESGGTVWFDRSS